MLSRAYTTVIVFAAMLMSGCPTGPTSPNQMVSYELLEKNADASQNREVTVKAHLVDGSTCATTNVHFTTPESPHGLGQLQARPNQQLWAIEVGGNTVERLLGTYTVGASGNVSVTMNPGVSVTTTLLAPANVLGGRSYCETTFDVAASPAAVTQSPVPSPTPH